MAYKCKEKRRRYNKKYYEENKEKRKEKRKEYYQKNKEKFRKKNPDYNKIYYRTRRTVEGIETNRKKTRERSRILVKALDDQYIKRLLVQRHGIERKNLTKCMVELKRESLILYREKKESKIFIRKLLGLTIKKPKIAENGENPCRICKLIDQDKNNPECMSCTKRIEYLRKIEI